MIPVEIMEILVKVSIDGPPLSLGCLAADLWV